VTGAASGIGKAIAVRLAAEGACVVVADLDAAKALAVAAEIGSADVAIGVGADVSDEDAVATARPDIVDRHGRLLDRPFSRSDRVPLRSDSPIARCPRPAQPRAAAPADCDRCPNAVA